MIKELAKKHSVFEVFLYHLLVVVQKKSFQALYQHASSKKHVKESATKLAPIQLRLAYIPAQRDDNLPTTSHMSSVNTSQISPQCIKLYNVAKRNLAAELKWVIKCVVSNYSVNPCDGFLNSFMTFSM